MLSELNLALLARGEEVALGVPGDSLREKRKIDAEPGDVLGGAGEPVTLLKPGIEWILLFIDWMSEFDELRLEDILIQGEDLEVQ